MPKTALLSTLAVALLLSGCVTHYQRPVATVATAAAVQGPLMPDVASQTASLGMSSSTMEPIAVVRQRISCVPYARSISGVELRGDAWTWWKGAEGVYERGGAPEIGAIIVMSRSKTMGRGHVGMVTKILNSREIQIDHANWKRGELHLGALVRDVSDANDWSAVQVWYPAINGYGTGVHKVSGFIYPQHL
jgi:surface antigen